VSHQYAASGSLLTRLRSPKNPELLYKFLISGFEGTFGHILPNIIQAISWGSQWEIDHEHRSLELLGSNLEERNKNMHDTLITERENKSLEVFADWRDELFPVYGPGKELVVSVERCAAQLFGILTYGVQLLAYQDNPEGISIWVARRATWKRSYPNMLDSTVGGSLPTGESPFECLLREGSEEAGLSPDFVKKNVVPCGTVNYTCITDDYSRGEKGLLSPEVQFCYELKLPKDMALFPGEAAVQEIVLINVEQMKEALAKGEFAPLTGCLILDFFVRHGILTFENEPNYISIASRMHKALNMETM
jgi:8-oxo-dGTP pyrophosphatase MutT (NUDIX family)